MAVTKIALIQLDLFNGPPVRLDAPAPESAVPISHEKRTRSPRTHRPAARQHSRPPRPRATATRVQQLELENARLKKLLAERDLEIEVMKELYAAQV